MAQIELEHLIAKVSTIQTQLGGASQNLLRDKNEDEFNLVKVKVAESINLLSKKQEERDESLSKNGRGIRVIKLGVEIQDVFTDLDLQLGEMNDILRRQRKNPKKYPSSEIEVKQQQYEKYRNLVEQLKSREEGDTLLPEEKPVLLSDLKLNLTGQRPQRKIDVDRELNDIEADAIKRFKQKDEEMDEIVDQVNYGLEGLKNKAMMMGDALDDQQKNIKGLEIEIEKTNKEIVNSNTRLKKVLYQYRAPSKFCMDVICVLILLGLIAVIIKLAKQ